MVQNPLHGVERQFQYGSVNVLAWVERNPLHGVERSTVMKSAGTNILCANESVTWS